MQEEQQILEIKTNLESLDSKKILVSLLLLEQYQQSEQVVAEGAIAQLKACGIFLAMEPLLFDKESVQIPVFLQVIATFPA